MTTTLTLRPVHLERLLAQAHQSVPNECCGLIGGSNWRASSTYPLANVAANPTSEYEAAPEDLFNAQRSMRERGEQLLAIYHSHPRQAEPVPSDTDMRLAYYPQAVYIIIGLGGAEPRIGAFRLSAEKRSWETADLQIVGAQQERT